MKTIFDLTRGASDLVKPGFKFESTQDEIVKSYNAFILSNFYTDNDNRRFPNYYQSSVSSVYREVMQNCFELSLIYCYEIDGQLFTTYNSDYKQNYYFIGTTDIKNYRVAGKEEKLNDLRRSNIKVKSGFYYGSGKEYFINPN